MTRFQNRILRTKISICLTAILLIFSHNAFSSVTAISSVSEYLSIDLPEGFYLVSSAKDGKSYQLQSSILPVSAAIKIYDDNIYKTAEEALSDNLKRLKAQHETDTFKWRNQDFAISSYTNYMGQSYSSGYAAAVKIPEKAGLIVILIWTDQSKLEYCNDFMLSFIDSLCIDYGSYYEAGPITTYAYPHSEKFMPVSMNIADKKINSFIRESDKEANEYLIQREYNVLRLYINNPLWKDAWTRYYRLIFRDSFKRLNRVSFDIYNELSPTCKDETDLAQKLLSWTQEMSYEREKNSSDFASLPSMLAGQGSDCDSRTMLLCVLLKSLNMDSIMFVSNVYSHAVAGLISSHPGHSFKIENKDYLIGETTSKGLTWGMIAEQQDNQSNWIAVPFY